jgi:hypothetical protein
MPHLDLKNSSRQSLENIHLPSLPRAPTLTPRFLKNLPDLQTYLVSRLWWEGRVFPPDISMRRLHARKYLCAPRLFRDILCFIAVVIIVSGNIIVFLNPYLRDMTCPIDALQPCIFSMSASSFAPRCSPALDTLCRSSLWTQAGHPIVSNISSCTESFVSGFLDAFGIWPSSLRLKHTSAEGLKPNPSVVVASFRLKSYRRPHLQGYDGSCVFRPPELCCFAQNRFKQPS